MIQAGLDLAYDAQVTITSQDGSTVLVLNTSDAQAATTGAVPSAVDHVSIEWSRTSARDHMEPATVALDLILDSPTHPVLAWDSHVLVTGRIVWLTRDGVTATSRPLTWARGWIDKITSRRRRLRHPDTGATITTWAHHVTITDLVGRANGTKVGAAPWPEEFPSARLPRIEAAAPYPLMSATPWPENWQAGYVAARDVDNAQLLDPLREMAAGMMLTIHDSPDGLVLQPFPGNALAQAWGQSTDLPRPPATLSARWLTDADRITDRSTRVTAVSIKYVEVTGPNPEDRENTSVVVRDTAATATAEASVQTDLVHDPDFSYDSLGALTTWAAAVVAMTAQPIAVPDPLDLLMDPDVPADQFDFLDSLVALCDLDGRSSQIVNIPDAPDGIGTWYHVLGGAYELAPRDRQPRIRLTLAPTELTGQRALTWGDFPATFATGNPATWSMIGSNGGGPTGSEYVSWGELTVSTLPKGPTP